MHGKSTIVILEDAQFLTMGQRGASDYTTEQPFVFQNFIMGRYAKLKLLCVTQGLSQVKNLIKQNSSFVMIKGVHTLEESHEAGALLNFPEKNTSEALLNLNIDEAFIIDKTRSVSGIKIKTNDFPDFHLKIDEINDFRKDEMNEILSHVVFKTDEIADEVSTTDGEELSYQLKIVMEDLKKFPFDFQKERCERLNLNDRIIADNLEELVKEGWLSRYESLISLGKGRGQFQAYLFTEKAVKDFGRQNIKGKGSIEHSFYQYRIAKYYSGRGYKTEIEYFPFRNDESQSLESIDVYAENERERISIEIELNDTPHIIDNIKKCIITDCDKLIMAVYGSKLMKRVQSMVLSNPEMEALLKANKIEIKMLSAFWD